MTFKLGKNIQIGQKIKTSLGWRKIKNVTSDGAVVKEGLIKFGSTVYGWKAQKRDRLNASNHQKAAERLRELFPLIEEYQKTKMDLTLFGYKIETGNGLLKIWKEI